LTDIFAIKYEHKSWHWTPEDPSLFREVTKCVSSLVPPGSPILFSTCGGGHNENGVLKLWPGKGVAQQRLSDLLERPVISAVGPCCAEGIAGTYCEQGWFETRPNPIKKTAFFQ